MSENENKINATENQFERFIARNNSKEFPTFGKMNSDYVSPTPELAKVIEGAHPNCAIYYVQGAGMFGEPPHTHTNDEYLVFVSADPHDMKNLGATIEIAFGQNWEKVEFSTSCAVKFPKGIQHCPIHVKKFERPFLFGHLWPMAEKNNFIPAV
jgi:hypothetical protein